MSLSSSLCLRDGFLLMSPVKQMLQRAGSPVVLMFRLFFNYLSIVEICIDKGLSGGDLCSCQLSPHTPFLGHQLDRSACKNGEAFLAGHGDGPGARGPKREGGRGGVCLAGWGAKELVVGVLGGGEEAGSMGPAWPLTWGNARESRRRVSGSS